MFAVDFAAHGPSRRLIASLAIEVHMSFGNEEEPFDQLVAEAISRAAAPQTVVEHLRDAAEHSLRTNPVVTLSLATVVGFIAGALWKA